MLGKIESRRRKWCQRMRWLDPDPSEECRCCGERAGGGCERAAAHCRAAEGSTGADTRLSTLGWGTAWRRAHRAAPAAAASSAHWSWTLALLALRDRCCKRRENSIAGVGQRSRLEHDSPKWPNQSFHLAHTFAVNALPHRQQFGGEKPNGPTKAPGLQ